MHFSRHCLLKWDLLGMAVLLTGNHLYTEATIDFSSVHVCVYRKGIEILWCCLINSGKWKESPFCLRTYGSQTVCQGTPKCHNHKGYLTIFFFFWGKLIWYCQTPNELPPEVIHSFNIRWRYIPFDDVIFF